LLDKLFHVLLTAGALGTVALMLYTGDPSQPEWWPGFLAFGAWVVAPYWAAARLAGKLWGSPPAAWLMLLTAATVVSVTGVLLWNAFVLRPDAGSESVIHYLPVWQAGVWAVGLYVARGMRRRGGAGI
jgi:hypothetical protein